jgi:probable rRNA maturation factor
MAEMQSGNYSIYINIEEPYQADAEAIAAAVDQALMMGQAPIPVALTVTVTSSERVHELNLQYAGIDSTTDVLSFPAEGDPYAVEPGEAPYIGDILIAYPVAESQAAQAGTPVIAELQLLSIHGSLHLLGYDHDTPDRQAEMWAYQSAAMDAARAARGA